MIPFKDSPNISSYIDNALLELATPAFWAAHIGWMSKVTLVILVAMISSRLILQGLRALLDKAETDNALQLRYIIPFAARAPLSVLVWLTALGINISILENQFGLNPVFAFYQQIQPILNIAVFAWFFLRLNRLIFRDILATKTQVTAASRDLGQKLGTVTICLIAVLFTLPYMGVSLASILTVGGIGGLAIGFASKDMLSNFIGAIVLHFDQPFKVGEWIKLPDQNVEGSVESIGWRQVVVRDLKKQLVYVPNKLFSNVVLENPDRMSHRRLREYITLRYTDFDKIDAVCAGIETYLKQTGQFDPVQTLIVQLDRLNPSSLDILVMAYTPLTDYPAFMALKHKILMQIGQIVADNGAAFAYPSMTVFTQPQA